MAEAQQHQPSSASSAPLAALPATGNASLPRAADRIAALADEPPPMRPHVDGSTSTKDAMASILQQLVDSQRSQHQQWMDFQRHQSEAFTAALVQLTQTLSGGVDASWGAAATPSVSHAAPSAAASPSQTLPIPKELDKVILKRTRSYRDDVLQTCEGAHLQIQARG